MKKPLLRKGKLSLYAIILLALASTITIYFAGVKFESKEEEGENEGEGVPGVYLAMDLWSNMRTYPFKSMPAEGFSESFAETKRMGLQNKLRLSNARGANVNVPPPWTPLGPMNFAGRTLCLAFHPTNPNIMFAGSAGGGIWKTTVAGSTGSTGYPAGVAWTYVPTGYPTIAVSSIIINPSNPNEMYAGTGEVYNSAAPGVGPIGAGTFRLFRGSYGVGILKSIDGGTTWTKSLDFSYSNLKGVSDMAFDPNNPLIVYAATTDGLYRTINGGASWQLVLNVPLAMDLAYKPGSSTTLYAAIGDLGSTGSGVYKTTDADNSGTPTFTLCNNGIPFSGIGGKIQLAVTPLNTNLVYASIGNDPITQTGPEGLYKSTNSGTSWAAAGAASIITNQGWYSHDIAIDPSNVNQMYWGELNLYKSTNGGTSFSVVSDWSQWSTSAFAIGGNEYKAGGTNYVHADIHRIYSPAANTVYMCTDGGIFMSSNMNNAAPTFSGRNGGMQTTQIYQNIAIGNTDPNFMLGGLQDNEGVIYRGLPNCGKVGGLGDGFHCAIDPTNDNNCFTESYYLNAKKSTNKGVNWGAMSASGPVNLGNPPSETVCFNAPLVIAPNNPAIMYAGSCKFKKSTDNGTTWVNMNGGADLSNANCQIIYIAVAPTNANIAYVSTAPAGAVRSRLFKTTNGGTSFTEITGTLPDRYYSSIAVDPTDPNRIVVALSGFTPLASESQIYMSHNGGTSWSNIGNNLPDVPINVVRFDATDRAGVYVGTDVGVFYGNGLPTSGVLGANTFTIWTGYNEGLGDGSMISDIQFTNTTPKKLRLATYGRGFWERALAPQNLPVVFKDFTVSVGDKGNNLKWTVSEQINVSRYEVEYSTNATNFKVLASIPATTGTGDITYTYLHAIRNDVNGYYRIKSIDLDGEISYSHIEDVKAEKLVTKLNAYPNPTTGIFKIQVPTSIGSTFNMSIYDASGRLVFTNKYQKLFAVDIPVNITRMAAGNYQVVCEDEQTKYTIRILKR